MYKIYTYATHSQGTFEDLLNNKFGVKINVVGMGDKWISFVESKMMKIKNELENLDSELVIIFLDGFDTVINKHPDIAYDYYMQNSPDKILISKECEHNNMFATYFYKKVFLSSDPANSGMLMGKVKYMKKLYNNVIDYYKQYNITDDQRLINMFHTDLKLDRDNYVFHNLNYNERNENYSNYNAVFLQTPGLLTSDRIFRSIMDYTPYFIEEILLLFIIIILFLVILNHLTKGL